MKNRQKLRKGIVLVSFFLFPAIFYYLSPVIIIQASRKGVINGSFIVFLLMFAVALVFGRAYCGWVCPGAGCQESLFAVRDKKINKANWFKWAIWVPWLAGIAIAAYSSGGYHSINFFYQTTNGLSVASVEGLVVYLSVLFFLIVLPGLLFGRRSFCHHLCWMAPFMITARWMRNRLGWASLRLEADPDKCIHCHSCSSFCPMSLPVEDMASLNQMESLECILCGTCVDICKKDVIRFSFSSTPR